mgnify:CR=1 FL=1
MKFPHFFAALLVFIALTLSGCGHTTQVVHDTQYVLIEPSAEMVKDCDLGDPPPDAKTYINSVPAEKERQLHDYAASAQLAFKLCNARWPKMRDWVAQQKKNYQSTSVKE